MARVLEDLKNLVPIQILILISLGLQFILFLCARARRRETSSSVQVRMILLWVAHYSSDIFGTYTLARLFSAMGNHPLVVLWAPFLLLHLAGPDNIAAYSLQDSQLSLRSLQTFFSQVTAGGYFLYTYRNISGDFIRLASRLMFVVGVVKYAEKCLAVQRGNLGSIRDSVKKQQVPAMNCCHVHPQDIKLEEIDGLETLDEESIVRRAHSLFHICKSGMVDYSGNVPQRQNFMGNMEHVELWAIVEIELSLMYDIMYTKAAVIHTWHGYTIRVISPLAILTSLLLFQFSEEHGHRAVDTATTYVLFCSALFMECTSLLNMLGSSWMFAYLSTTRSTWLRCSFLCSGRWDRLRPLILSLNSLVTCGGSSRSGARRWSGHMGQYNMLHFCTRPNDLLSRPLLGRLAELVGLGELWNRKHFSGAIKISDHDLIKGCINNHTDLLYREGWIYTLGTIKHEWGMTALVHRQEEYSFKGTLGIEFQEGIIIWHIGTDFFLSKCNSGNASVGLVKAIKALSNYMMFLLVERPYMLPGIAQNKLYERTCEALKGMSHHPTSICAMLKSLFRWHDEPAWGNTSRVTDSKKHAENLYDKHVTLQEFSYETVRLNYSATVAHELLRYEKKHDTTKSLQLLLEVWTDMLVYAGNRCSRESHAKNLSRGELTTIVWLMVEHYHQALLELDSKQASAKEPSSKEEYPEHFHQASVELDGMLAKEESSKEEYLEHFDQGSVELDGMLAEEASNKEEYQEHFHQVSVELDGMLAEEASNKEEYQEHFHQVSVELDGMLAEEASSKEEYLEHFHQASVELSGNMLAEEASSKKEYLEHFRQVSVELDGMLAEETSSKEEYLEYFHQASVELDGMLAEEASSKEEYEDNYEV